MFFKNNKITQEERTGKGFAVMGTPPVSAVGSAPRDAAFLSADHGIKSPTRQPRGVPAPPSVGRARHIGPVLFSTPRIFAPTRVRVDDHDASSFASEEAVANTFYKGAAAFAEQEKERHQLSNVPSCPGLQVSGLRGGVRQLLGLPVRCNPRDVSQLLDAALQQPAGQSASERVRAAADQVQRRVSDGTVKHCAEKLRKAEGTSRPRKRFSASGDIARSSGRAHAACNRAALSPAG